MCIRDRIEEPQSAQIHISRLQTVLRTGRVMKLLEADIDQPQFAWAGCTCTGMPCFRFSKLVVTTI